MSTATTNGKNAAKAPKANPIAGVATWADERTGLAGLAKKQIRKVFPDHWSSCWARSRCGASWCCCSPARC